MKSRMRHLATLCLAALAALAAQAHAASGCSAQSGAGRVPLVELYTSEGCSSCPPAERTLARLAPASANAPWLALSWHVDYWDELGWTDAYARPAYGARQSWLAQRNGRSQVYTPHVFVDGVESASDEQELRVALGQRGAAAVPAGTLLRMSLERDGAATSRLAVVAQAPAGTQLHLALAQNGLATHVGRGENAGATLHHDHVVRAWYGPLPMGEGPLQWTHTLDAQERRQFAAGEWVAFLEDPHDGRILQSLRLGACTPP